MVLCVLTKGVRTMARITAKKYIAAKQMKKRRLYFRGQTRRCSLRLCYRRRGEKQRIETAVLPPSAGALPTCAAKSGLHKESWRKKRIFRWYICQTLNSARKHRGCPHLSALQKRSMWQPTGFCGQIHPAHTPWQTRKSES